MIVPLLLTFAPCLAADDWRADIEADWARGDTTRATQLQQAGTLRLPGGVVQWPGLASADQPAIPETAAPELDGDLSDGCWAEALTLEPPTPGDPTYRLCHDGELLYVSAGIPAASEMRFRGPRTAADAAGAVDGVKNGLYAFHTGGDKNPWWQVDLQKPEPIGRIVVYNRLDYQPGLHNADNLNILVSDDGEVWRVVHENRKHFGGVSGAPPLEVAFEGLTARFVRLQVAEDRPLLFHLDEVEVYSAVEPEKNLALRKPATQSSLSMWSKGGAMGSACFQIAGAPVGLTADDPPRVTMHEQVVGYSGARRTDEGLTLEVAFALSTLGRTFPSEVQLAGGVGRPVRLGGQWEVAWPEATALGFGKNRLEFEITSQRAFTQPVTATVETIVLTPTQLCRRVAGHASFAEPGPAAVDFTLDHEGPAAAIVTLRQGQSEYVAARPFFVPPVRETVLRTQALLSDFGRSWTPEVRDLRKRMQSLEETERTSGSDPASRAALYREARWLAREVAFENPALGDSLVLVKRHTQQAYPDVCLNHMPWVSRPGGDVCILSPIRPDGEVTPLLQGALGPGHVHGMDLSADAKRVTFGYAKAKSDEPAQNWLVRNLAYELRRSEEPIHIFEMSADGSGLRQLTDGEWSDLDPTYLADGSIAFVSERCGYSLQCNEFDKDETSCNLYAVEPDSGDVRRLTVSKDGDYLPHLLDNGLIAYTRWEYQERSFANIQSVWIVAPDGTGADALYKQHFNDPWALEEMRSIPGSHKMAAIATGHHTLPSGPLVVLDHHLGMNDPAGIGIVTPGIVSPEGGMSGLAVPEGGVPGVGGHCMTPFPLSEKHFLTSYTYGPETDENGYALYLVDVHGTRELVYRDPEISSIYPMPLQARTKAPVLAGVREPDRDDATCVVTDIYQGVTGIERGAIKYLRVAQRLAWPYDNERGGLRYEPDVKSVMVNWTPVRILGDIPVEDDGSAHFRVPTDTPVYFQALDEDRMELQRMRSFINFQPGEVRSCSGCHETRGVAPTNPPSIAAVKRGPSEFLPAPWGDQPISFLRDVQPIFDRQCVTCHSGLKPAQSLDFSGGLTPSYNVAYETITRAKLVARSNIMEDARVTEPLAFGSHKSKLIDVLRTTHKDRVRLSERERLGLVMWIDGNAPYDAEFINKRVPVQPYNLAADTDLRGALADVHSRRCAQCHEPAAVTRLDWVNLSDPKASRFLSAPLAASAGGEAKCEGAVYVDASDADYAALLARITEAVQASWKRPRRDVATLPRPSKAMAELVARE